MNATGKKRLTLAGTAAGLLLAQQSRIDLDKQARPQQVFDDSRSIQVQGTHVRRIFTGDSHLAMIPAREPTPEPGPCATDPNEQRPPAVMFASDGIFFCAPDPNNPAGFRWLKVTFETAW